MTTVEVEGDRGLRLRVGDFEGPLDLLLHLCRTNEIDLARLPVRTITDQYVAHLEAMDFRDLEAAGAYLVMAATLLYLKSRLLVPQEAPEQLDEEGESLRGELEERLREYARIKVLGAWLARREAEQALVFGRTTSDLPPPDDVPLEDLSVHLLERALRRLIDEQARRKPRDVQAECSSA
jgi:segregation and condensation protein A